MREGDRILINKGISKKVFIVARVEVPRSSEKAFVSKSGGPLLVIYTIGREGHRWTISLDEGQFAFDSAGFKQYIRREPILKSHFTYLSDSERGGFSFRRSYD